MDKIEIFVELSEDYPSSDAPKNYTSDEFYLQLPDGTHLCTENPVYIGRFLAEKKVDTNCEIIIYDVTGDNDAEPLEAGHRKNFMNHIERNFIHSRGID